MRHLILAVLSLGLGLGGLGCAGDTSSPVPGSAGTQATKAPPFAEGQGQAAGDTEAYAAGPYGLATGSVIANFKFLGFPNEQADKGQNGLQTIQLADFYNPTGDGKYPEGSPFGAGTPKPKALVIDVASVWCGPCNEEAKNVLPGLHLKYKPRGGEFLLQLADGPTPGTAAIPSNLFNWTSKYKVDYPGTLDPSYKLNPLFTQDAFPQNFMIDTKTMKIVRVVAGVPDPTYWTKFETLLNP